MTRLGNSHNVECCGWDRRRWCGGFPKCGYLQSIHVYGIFLCKPWQTSMEIPTCNLQTHLTFSTDTTWYLHQSPKRMGTLLQLRVNSGGRMYRMWSTFEVSLAIGCKIVSVRKAIFATRARQLYPNALYMVCRLCYFPSRLNEVVIDPLPSVWI